MSELITLALTVVHWLVLILVVMEDTQWGAKSISGVKVKNVS